MTFTWLSKTTGSEGQRGRYGARRSVFPPPYFKAEAVKKISRQVQVLFGKSHLLYVVEVNYTFTFSSFVFSLYVHNDQAKPMSTARRRPNQPLKKCQDQMSHAFVPPADKLLIRPCRCPPFNHLTIRTRTKCWLRALTQDPSPTDSFVKKIFFFPPSFSFTHFPFFISSS